MMYHKAMLFASTDPKFTSANEALAQKVLTTISPFEVKKMGRLVKGFTEETWHEYRKDIVLAGSILKFRQNPDLAKDLLATGEKILVEASPMDKIWGIGMDAKRAASTLKSEGQKRWGLNLLGWALEETRTILRVDEQGQVVEEAVIGTAQAGPSTEPQPVDTKDLVVG
jgi:ribA/ribD-fused uncharacterized protein